MGVSNSLLESSIPMLAFMLMMLGFFFGTPLIRVLRKTYGARVFWISGLVLTLLFMFAFPPLFILVVPIWMTLGIYMELESRGARWTTSAAVAILSGVAVIFATTAFGILASDVHSLAEAKTLLLTQFSEGMKNQPPEIQAEMLSWFQIVPALIVVTLVISLASGLMFEKRAYAWLKAPREKVASQLKLLEFRLPDFIIWPMMLGFLLVAKNFGSEALGIFGKNLAIIGCALFFFQGLSVVEATLRSFRAGVMVKVAVYLILVTQALPLVVIGVIDYWVDFRKRLRNLRSAPKKN